MTPPVAEITSLQRRSNMLLFGRADDPLKGGHTALSVLSNARNQGIDTQLTILGSRSDDMARQERAIRDEKDAAVKLKPFTSDRSTIEAELRGADLVLMPSRHEGFGLVATEAAGYGVPVLVGDNTGAGMFFDDPNRIPPELGQACVVRTPPPPGPRRDTQCFSP